MSQASLFRSEKDSQHEEKKISAPNNKKKEELNMPASVLKEKSHVEAHAESVDKKEMVPEWMRYLIRSLDEAEERKKKRLEEKSDLYK
ncbi:MAG: hypothetical protein HOC91_18425 [Nitrospinaceae bacterium]|nr:hypothetical protein [Nitrospinaceae bacterium]MBT3434791.1 hypothetical protein [Nitrospinaceae bacterium]MBT3822007.1 hypothetical protein [Nitrospinaceae bacterium]MBT4094736.1 hypothetical protein [Nitrospinaceae bacterium]MBT4432490.1 hypothetical protein [Nitrospinaceae bacterium]